MRRPIAGTRGAVVSTARHAEGHFRMSDGFDLFFRNWKAAGEARRSLLCLHGIEGHSGAFGFLGNDLSSRGSDVYAIDRRGFGNSVERGRPRGDTRDFRRHLTDLDEAVREIRRVHAGRKLFLLCHSIGCAYALWYVANHPGSIDGVVLAAPPLEPGFKLPATDLLGLVLRRRKMYDLLDRWPDAFKRSEEFRLLSKDPLCTRKFSGRYLIKTQTNLAGKMARNASRTFVPALVLQGAADIIALPSGARALMDRLGAQDKSLKVFPGANHWFYRALIPGWTPESVDIERALVSRVVSEWLEARQAA